MISRRSLETVTALLTGAFGAAVVISSRDNGIGWSAAGVDAGTFPFIVGLIILGGSIFNLATGWPRNDYPMLRPNELKRLARLFVPAAIFIGLIPLTGMVVASAGYVFAALISHRKGAPMFAGVAAIGTALALYLIFELAFQVSLPRGMLGTALGF
jgi:hypothetical protein